MKLVSSIEEWRQIHTSLKATAKPAIIGLVPTMGYLHDGHLSLVKAARQECDVVVMSIFVNPLQFGENEDFDRYPRDLKRDQDLAEQHQVDYLFVPEAKEMYPEPPRTSISVTLGNVMCGRHRPGHFDGVALVVTKLFNIIQPDFAYFGQKDAQQLAIIEQMVNDLNIPVTIRPCPTVREPDGLAMSSRNVYLSPEERKQAVQLYKSLQAARSLIEAGERDPEVIKNHVTALLATQPDIRLEYVELRSYPDLTEINEVKGKVIVALAAHLGQTRLIDNVILEV